MPKNSPTGFVTAFFATFIGFALIWHIWWLAIVCAVGAYATFVVFAWRDEAEYEIPAEEVERIDRDQGETRERLGSSAGSGSHERRASGRRCRRIAGTRRPRRWTSGIGA